jgi:hypothetical protein
MTGEFRLWEKEKTMFAHKYTLEDDGTVNVNGNDLEQVINQLKDRLKDRVSIEGGKIIDNLLELRGDMEAAEYGYLTEKGLKEFDENLAKTSELLSSIENLVELGPEAYKQLEDLRTDAAKTEPDITIEEVLSRIILKAPLPE